MTPRRIEIQKSLAAAILTISFGIATMAPAFADGWRGHERIDHRGGHEWRDRDWRQHEWREHHGYRYGYGYAPGYYAYPGYYYAPAPAYAAPPSLTVVVPFR